MWPHNRAKLISNARGQRGHQRAHFNDKSSSPDCDSLRAMNVETNFANFWPVYVRAHSRPGTRAIHLAGTLAGWMLLVASVTLQRWWCIALALVVSYALAWISHFFCRAQPASHVQTRVVVMVGGSEDGGADAHRENGRRSAALRRWELESGS